MNQSLIPLVQLMKGRNPQEVVMNMLKNNKNLDPMIGNLVQLAQKGDEESVMKVAESFFKARGIDFDSEFNEFMSLLK